MKRALFWMGVILLFALIIVNRNDENNIHRNRETFVMRYDNITYDLELYLHDMFRENIFFYDRIQFHNFDTETFRSSIHGLVDKLDAYAEVMDQSCQKINDAYVKNYGEKIKESTLNISGHLTQYLKQKMVNSIAPNITTLYKDTYILMDAIHEDLLVMYDNQEKLDRYIRDFRHYELRPTLYHTMKELSDKNTLRLLYTYLYTACYIGSHDDYTGLHTNPKVPWFLDLNDGSHILYELNIGLLKRLEGFYQAYIDMHHLTRSYDEQVALYAKLITKVMDGIENFIEARALFPDDYFRAYDFLEDQSIKYEKLSIIFYDFDYDSHGFSALKNAYFQVKFITDRSPLNLLMFEEEELPSNYEVLPFN